MNTEKGRWILLFVACLMTASACPQIEESPEDIYNSTCNNTTKIQFVPNDDYLVVSASLGDCAKAEGISASSVVFKSKARWIDPNYEYAFEYTVMAPDVDSNCVVSISCDAITDQNGLSNDPLEDISHYALNEWYTRKFPLNTSSCVGDLWIGFECAARTPILNNSTAPTILVRDVRLVSTDLAQPIDIIYNYQVCAGGCGWSSLTGTLCMRSSDGSAQLTYPSSLTIETIAAAVPLVVLGDVQVYNLRLQSSLNVTGCISDLYFYGLMLSLAPLSSVTIYYRADCFAPIFNIMIDPTASNTPTPPYDGCFTATFPERVDKTVGPGFVSFFAPSNTIQKMCNLGDDDDDYHPSNYDFYHVTLPLLIVLPTVGAVGIFLGIFFGVRKYKQQKLEALSSVEVNME